MPDTVLKDGIEMNLDTAGKSVRPTQDLVVCTGAKPVSFLTLLLLFLASILTTLGFWFLLPDRVFLKESADYRAFYHPVGRSIADGRGIRGDDGAPATRYPPGFALLVAGALVASEALHAPETLPLRVLNLFALATSSIFLFQIAYTIFGLAPALVSYGLWLSYPFVVALTKAPGTELPFCALVFAAFHVAWRAIDQNQLHASRCLLIGLLLGYAMLVRPIGIGLGVLTAAFLFRFQAARNISQRLRPIGLILLGNLMVVLPWEAWAYSQSGQWILLSTGGPPGMRDGLTFAVHPDKRYRVETRIPADAELVSQAIVAHYRSLDSASDILGILATQFRESPRGVAELLLVKAVRSWYATDSGRLDRYILPIQIVYLSLAIWATVISFRTSASGRRLSVVVWLSVLYFWMMTVSVLSILRYMIPAMGLLFLLIPALLRRAAEPAGQTAPAA